MSITTQKYLVGIIGLILTGSVIATGYLDAQRRRQENPPPGVAASPSTPSTPLSPELEQGRKIYDEYSCAACHGQAGKGGVHNVNAQTGQEVPALIHVAESYTKPDLIAKIQNGVPIEPKLNPNGPAPPLHMPAFKDLLTQQQMNELVAYLFSLKPKEENLGF